MRRERVRERGGEGTQYLRLKFYLGESRGVKEYSTKVIVSEPWKITRSLWYW